MSKQTWLKALDAADKAEASMRDLASTDPDAPGVAEAVAAWDRKLAIASAEYRPEYNDSGAPTA
jgi:hypothetical protein